MSPEVYSGNPWLVWLSVLIMAGGSVLVLLVPRAVALPGRRPLWLGVAFFLLSRVIFLVLILVLFDHRPGPDKLVWELHGVGALNGELPYLDYPSEYGPLFSYLLAPAFLVFDTYVAPLVVFILFDGLACLLVYRLFDDYGQGRKVTGYYLVSPLSWFMIVRYGQDEVIGVVLVLAAMLLRRRHMQKRVVGWVVLGALLTKMLFLVVAAPVLMRCRRPLAALLACGALVGLCLLPFLLAGADLGLFVPSAFGAAGASVWQIANLFHPVDRALAGGLFLAVMGGLALWLLRRRGETDSIDASLALFAAVALFSPKAWPTYALLFLPFLAARTARAEGVREVVLFALYSFAANVYVLVYPAIWRTEFDAGSLSAFLTVAFLIGFHSYLLADSLRRTRSGSLSA